MTDRHECGLDRTFCTKCQTELEVGQVGLCGVCCATGRIDLPLDGTCPCGCKDLMLARDQTEYTPVSKNGAWEYGASYTEQIDSDDPMGNIRLFCTACSQYFNVPDEVL